MDTPTESSVQGVKTTHYNLIDTLIRFMGAEAWKQACALYAAYMATKGFIYRPEAVAKIYRDHFQLTQPVATTLVEAVEFAYVMNYGYKAE